MSQSFFDTLIDAGIHAVTHILAEKAFDVAVEGMSHYAAHQQMSQNIDHLLRLPEDEIIPTVICGVIEMDNETWQLFSNCLAEKAKFNENAQGLLAFSVCTVEAQNELNQLLNYGVQDAFTMLVEDVFPQKDEIRQLIFLGVLSVYANSDIKAKSILNRLQPLLTN